MMFEELYHLRLSHLTAAVDDWSAMVTRLEGLSEEARSQLHVRSGDREWQGENARASVPYIRRTAEQFRHAHSQAEATLRLLRALLSHLTAHRRALRECVEAAPSLGLHIDATGRVWSADHRNINPVTGLIMEAAPGLSHPIPEETRAAMRDMATRLGSILQSATDDDATAARALREIVADGTGEFRESHYRNWEATGAEHAVADAEEFIALAQNPSLLPQDVARMASLMNQHHDDPAFADHVMSALGMRGMLDLSERLSGQPAMLLSGTSHDDMLRGLSNTMATALRTPDHLTAVSPDNPAYQRWLSETPEGRRYAGWVEEMHELGLERHDNPGRWEGSGPARWGRHGYHELTDLLEHAETPIGEHFLYELADGVISAEKKHPDIWYQFDTDEAGETVTHDLLHQVLGLAAHNNPAAAALILDPANNDHLEYVLGEKEDSRQPPDFWKLAIGWEASGLADALEAATIGRPPDQDPPPDAPPPSAAGARVMHEVVSTFSATPQLISDDGRYAFMRPQLGRMTAEYMGDFQFSLAGSETLPLPENSANLRGVPVGLFLEQVGRAPEAYIAISASQQAYTAVTVDVALNGETESTVPPSTRVTIAISPGAEMAGILTHARSSAIYDLNTDASVATYQKWSERSLNAVSDYATKDIPFAGTPVAKITDELNSAFFDSIKKDQEGVASKAANDVYESGRDSTEANAVAAVERALSNENADTEADLRDTARNAAHSGFNKGITRLEGYR
ncbi:hypothetical protein PJ985_10085 [Streptomyces sp. ACA25]|uniref:hypothetical protein n=1 Tax=Streptomyces sp. ACA25 TaxID=3022596 RepID=UPI0023077DC5|nr:hypothetical protein [Streptomyces sp. ACA25]MDB1087914.1 hypothetical protein [Streptomyces sp. ACA25]